MVMADTLAEDNIEFKYLRKSGSRPRFAAGSAVEHDIVMIVVAIVLLTVIRQFEVGVRRDQSSTD
jgi:hypothetical protein